jgi:hypothetical protein
VDDDVTHRLTIVGTVFVAVAMRCSVFLVGNVVYGSAMAAATAGLGGAAA